jgi:chromosome segregation ATPase
MKSFLFFCSVYLPALSLFATTEKPNFQDDIIPVFEQSCNSCHNPDKAKGGLDLTGINGIIAGGGSGDVAIPGDPDNSLIYLLAARLQEPHMPPRGEKIEKSKLLLIKNWIAQGMLPTASGKPMKKKKSSLNLALGSVSIGKPDGPPPMPKHLSLQPSVVSQRAFALSAMATAPWSPLIALAGQKQVLLYNSDSLAISGILSYEEGFIESLNFSRNGKLIIASGGRGGKSGNVVGWNIESGRRVLNVAAEQDSILTADISADQSLVAIGGTTKLIKVFDLATNEVLYKIKKHSEWVTQVAFSPDGILLATADRNGGLYVWEARTGNPFYSLDGHKQEITSLSWRSDGNVLLSASEEGAVRTWEMINGKQVKTWSAHSGGTLSAHYAQNGNIVTAGRDKAVKFWDGNGKALRTISGFTDIVMESRLSHDGSKIIAGDWTGKVGIWNSADGKKLGDLNANPPTLESRVSLAQHTLSHASAILKKAEVNLVPRSKAVEDLKKQVAAEKSALVKNEKALVDSNTKLQHTTKELDKTLADFESKRNIQAEKAKVCEDLKNRLSQNQQSIVKYTAEFNKFNKLAEQNSRQLVTLKESLRQAIDTLNQNKDDTVLAKAADQARESVEAMVKKHDHARKLAAENKTEMDMWISLKTSLKSDYEDATKSLEIAKQVLLNKSKVVAQQKDSLSQLKQKLILTTKNLDLSKNLLVEREKLLAEAEEKIKIPMAEVAKAKLQVKSAENSISKWKAEQINFTRHQEIIVLHSLEDELQSMDDLLEDSKNIFASARLAVDTATATLNSLPQKISDQQQALSQKKIQVETENARLAKITESKNLKASFIQQVDQIQKKNQQQASTEPENKMLAEAGTKLSESLSLLHKDLQVTDSKVLAKQQQIVLAKTAVSSAETELAAIMKMRGSAPKVLEEKESALKDAQNQLDLNQKNYSGFKLKVDQQKAKTDNLLQEYLKALPK